MVAKDTDDAFVHDLVVQAVATAKRITVGEVAEQDDVFAKFGLNSMEIFSVLVRLENALRITIGDDPSDFERVRSFGGLKALLREKAAFSADTAVEGPAT